MLNYHSIILILSILILLLSLNFALRDSVGESYLFLNENYYNKVYDACDYLRNTTEWKKCIQKNKKNC